MIEIASEICLLWAVIGAEVVQMILGMVHQETEDHHHQTEDTTTSREICHQGADRTQTSLLIMGGGMITEEMIEAVVKGEISDYISNFRCN